MAGKRRRSSKNKEKKEKGIPYFDYNLLFIVIFLLCFGLVMLYSSSAYTSAIKNHDSMHYLKLQIRFLSLVKVLAMLIPLIIVVAISNLSTAVIIIGISVCMLFVASPKYLQFIIVAVAVVVFAVAFVMLAGYRSTRIEAWLHPETAGTDAVFQTMMGLYAIGSGGLFGKGLGESLQKLGNVPESQNDMIFTIICEELGLFGAICLILLFILLIWRMMVIANNARDLYGSLLVIGVMSHIAIQVILNIAVVTNSLPNTGVILPFISYGGTSIIFLMAEIGLVLSVSRGIRLENV